MKRILYYFFISIPLLVIVPVLGLIWVLCFAFSIVNRIMFAFSETNKVKVVENYYWPRGYTFTEPEPTYPINANQPFRFKKIMKDIVGSPAKESGKLTV